MLQFLRRCTLCLCLFACFAAGSAAAAFSGTLFAVPQTGQDGQERWGYMNESGKLVIDYAFAAADPFDDSGAAAVYNDRGEAALIDRAGNIITGWQPAPNAVEFQSGIAAFRYDDSTAFFRSGGDCIGSFEGAAGFPADDRVCVRSGSGQNARYGYVDLDGNPAIASIYTEAGQFLDGRALVRDTKGNCRLIGTDGRELAALPAGASPAALEIYHKNVIILRNPNQKYALYSVEEMKFLTSYAYDEMLPFDNACAMIRVGTSWGLLSSVGVEAVAPRYPYMSAMGGGMYAVRGLDSGAAVINEAGKVLYRTDTYVGGFQTFRYGLSWHGTMDGSVVFFNATGTLRKTVENIESPEIVASSVARVARDGHTQYINMYNGKLLHDTSRSYALENGLHIDTLVYERYLGMRDDGSEFGWRIEYPRVTGLDDPSVQERANAAIRDFFTAGPAGLTAQTAIDATYGFSVEGQVLVVWAAGQYDSAGQSVLWNSSIGVDLKNGAVYRAGDDLFNDQMVAVTSALLPQEPPYYGSPRMDAEGVTFFRCHAASGKAQPYADALHLSWDALGTAIDHDSPCYRALTGFTGTIYADVPYGHWAFDAVGKVSARGLMTGSGGQFRPNDPILTSEVCAAIARALDLPDGVLPGIQPSAWYAGAVGAVYEAGLLAGFDTYRFEPADVMTRADAMQLLANVLKRQGRAGTEMTGEQVMEQLAVFADGTSAPESRRYAAAICVRAGLVRGDAQGLRPSDGFTRAEFAKLLLAVAEV